MDMTNRSRTAVRRARQRSGAVADAHAEGDLARLRLVVDPDVDRHAEERVGEHEARPERDRLPTGAAPRSLGRAGLERHDAMAVLRRQLDLLRQRPVAEARDAVRLL